MTVSFVTIVLCAHVTGTKKSMFFYCDKFLYHARAKDNGDKSLEQNVGNAVKRENATGTL